jgi:hypothetical protein
VDERIILVQFLEGAQHMTYEEFLKFVPAKCIYETIYEDTEGRPILIISMLAAYGMVNKAQRQWVGLTPEEVLDLFDVNNVYGSKWIEFARTVEAKLKEKNA